MSRFPTAQHIQTLVALGFEMENMELAWGAEYAGWWRWVLYDRAGNQLDWSDMEYGDEDALWAVLTRYHQEGRIARLFESLGVPMPA